MGIVLKIIGTIVVGSIIMAVLQGAGVVDEVDYKAQAKAELDAKLALWNAADKNGKAAIIRTAYEAEKANNCGGTKLFDGFSGIKATLRDPDSFQYISHVKGPLKGKTFEGGVRFRSKNGFGGYVTDTYMCKYTWDPEKQRF